MFSMDKFKDIAEKYNIKYIGIIICTMEETCNTTLHKT